MNAKLEKIHWSDCRCLAPLGGREENISSERKRWKKYKETQGKGREGNGGKFMLFVFLYIYHILIIFCVFFIVFILFILFIPLCYRSIYFLFLKDEF